MFVDFCEDSSYARETKKSTKREMRKCFGALSWLKGRLCEIYDTFVLQRKVFGIISVSVFSSSVLFLVRMYALSTNGHFLKLFCDFPQKPQSFICVLDGHFAFPKKGNSGTHIDIINPSSDPKWHLLKLMFMPCNLISEISYHLSARRKNPYQILLPASSTF